VGSKAVNRAKFITTQLMECTVYRESRYNKNEFVNKSILMLGFSFLENVKRKSKLTFRIYKHAVSVCSNTYNIFIL
jgi:hypothetical protein